jgi:hypothetical protein
VTDRVKLAATPFAPARNSGPAKEAFEMPQSENDVYSGVPALSPSVTAKNRGELLRIVVFRGDRFEARQEWISAIQRRVWCTAWRPISLAIELTFRASIRSLP